jgi:Polyketide cyclase / dehydrase and lipid transport
MRHADQPSVEVEVYVQAPAERIWPLLTDLDVLVSLSDELQAAEWENEGGAAVGRSFVGTNRNKYFGEWQTTSTVIECDEPRAFAWAVGDVDQPNTTWRFTVRSQGAGSLLSQWMRLGIGPSGLTVAIERMPDKEERIVERRLDEFRAAMRANLDAIKELAERPGP